MRENSSLVSINILTRNRAGMLKRALDSVNRQGYRNYEVIVVNDASEDETDKVLEEFINQGVPVKVFKHAVKAGITSGRQEALTASQGEFVAMLDDDDEWLDPDKLKKQVEFFKARPDAVLTGGGMAVAGTGMQKFRAQNDKIIRRTMLFRNNFFTSTIMMRKKAALEAGGFVKDGFDVAEDYGLWLRLLKIGSGYNFPEIFVSYASPSYNKDKKAEFLKKQLLLISRHKSDYPFYLPASVIIRLRLLLLKLT